MYGFGKPNYLQLALQPDELIRELYNDPIILKRYTGEIKSFPGMFYCERLTTKMGPQVCQKLLLSC